MCALLLLFIKIPINPEGPGEKYTPEVAEYLLQKDFDIVGFQENFNYYDILFPILEVNYQHDWCSGKISKDIFSIPFVCDGINLIWRKGIAGGYTSSASWSEAYGFYNHENDALTRKGFRRYELTLEGGSQLVV